MTDTDRTTATMPSSVRDRAKALRTVEEEPIWKVFDRALDALEGDAAIPREVVERNQMMWICASTFAHCSAIPTN